MRSSVRSRRASRASPRRCSPTGCCVPPESRWSPAAVSIGTNPHYGGGARRVEAYLLDFDGDLYGERLVVELWERLRDEAAFGSEEELVAAIADDVQRTRSARRPA